WAVAGAVRQRRTGPLRAPSLAALPGAAGGAGHVLHCLVVLAQAPAPLRGDRPVPAAVRQLPVPGRIRARARRPTGLSGIWLADDGAGVEPAADRARPAGYVAVAQRADRPARAADRRLMCVNTLSCCATCWSTAMRNPTVPVPAPAAYSVGRCASIWRRG